VNLTRLMVLGTLSRYGPLHGHQIRRIAEVTNVGEWGGVSVGALYRDLRVMERDGLVERIRTEQVGRRPERTVYQVTAEGRLELTTLRERAIKLAAAAGPDPLGVALSFGASGMDTGELRDMLRARRGRLAVSAEEITAERQRLEAKGYISGLQAEIMRRSQIHLEAEVRWHDELDTALAAGLVAEGSTLGGYAASADNQPPTED
jgi:DNA-binding PadR family transcriptional regulator